MGQTMSSCFSHLRKLANRYNAEYRAHAFLDKGKLPLAPRHPTAKSESELLKEKPHLKEEFKELYEKHPMLNEYLKKVYLTSTTEGEPVKSTRPLPQKRERDWGQLFYEPKTVPEGSCTLTQVNEIINKSYEDPEKWNPVALAKEYKLDKTVIIKILCYYSLFRIEKFEFLSHEEEKEDLVDKKQIEFDVFTALEKKPVKRIEGKK